MTWRNASSTWRSSGTLEGACANAAVHAKEPTAARVQGTSRRVPMSNKCLNLGSSVQVLLQLPLEYTQLVADSNVFRSVRHRGGACKPRGLGNGPQGSQRILVYTQLHTSGSKQRPQATRGIAHPGIGAGADQALHPYPMGSIVPTGLPGTMRTDSPLLATSLSTTAIA